MNSYASDRIRQEKVPTFGVRIRTAETADAAAVTSLLLELTRETAEGFSSEETVRGCAEELLAREGGVVLVAERLEGYRAGIPLAVCTLVFAPSPWVEGGTCEVRDLVVTKKERRSGLGARLLKEAFARARSRGATLVYLLTDERNAEAQAFYQGLGFRYKRCAYFEKQV